MNRIMSLSRGRTVGLIAGIRLSAWDWSSPSLRFRVFAVTISTLAFGLVATLAPRSPWDDLARTYIAYFSGAAGLTLLFLLPSFIWQRAADLRAHPDQTSGDWYRRYLRDPGRLDTLIAFAAFAFTVGSFTVYKTLVIRSGGFHWDATFAAFDRTLLGGWDAWQVTHGLWPQAAFTQWIDYFYHPAFLPMMIGYTACAGLVGRSTLRYTYMTAFLAGYVLIGMIAADLFDSAGPAFDGLIYGDGSQFGALQATLRDQSAAGSPLMAIWAQDYLLHAYHNGIVKVGSGISAMPSMHLVLASLWAFAAWSLSRTLGVVVTAYVLMIWIGSVHLGWHYAADGLVALLMTTVIWRIAGRTFGLIGRKAA
jgi:hypothetical protein